MTTKITGEQIGELTVLSFLIATLGCIFYLRCTDPNNAKQLLRKEKLDKRRARTSDANLARLKGTEYINNQSESDAKSAIKRAEQNYREAQGVKHKKIKKISKRTHTKSKNNKSRRK